MLRNINIPVVLTGSQLPITHPLTDAKENLFCAFSMAASGLPGVFVAFNRKVMLGTRAVKIRTMGIDAFESVNCPYVATVGANGLEINHSILPDTSGDFALKDKLEPNVFLLKVIPGLNPCIFSVLRAMEYKGIIVEAFGAGGLHFVRRNLISELKAAVDEGIAVVVSSQCLYERSDFSIYQTGRKALLDGRIIQGYDMTTEAAATKLMWCLGQTDNIDEIGRLFLTCFAGEVTI
jgi:L-asparaginase